MKRDRKGQETEDYGFGPKQRGLGIVWLKGHELDKAHVSIDAAQDHEGFVYRLLGALKVDEAAQEYAGQRTQQ